MPNHESPCGVLVLQNAIACPQPPVHCLRKHTSGRGKNEMHSKDSIKLHHISILTAVNDCYGFTETEIHNDF